MYSNSEYREVLRKVHPEYIQATNKGGEKWKEARVFWTILYPESSDDFIQKLANNFNAPCVLSPLHDKDMKEDGSGEIKKAHFHFLAQYSGKKNPYQFYVDLVTCFGEKCFNTIEIVSDLGAGVRYLCHMDEDETYKYRYNIEDLNCFKGFEVKKYLFEKVGDTLSNVEVMMDFIEMHDFYFYDDLAKYCRREEPMLFASLIKDREVRNFAVNYLKGREHSHWYSGDIEKGMERVRFKDNEGNIKDKYQFNRKIVRASNE